ncbi:MAG: FAD:protein FMN transferase [Acidobacteriota bacterium]
MGTVLEIDAAGGLAESSLEAAVESAFLAIGRVEGRLSNWRPDSELSRANRCAGGGPFSLSAATAESLSAALGLAEETGGTFDPTVGVITMRGVSLPVTGEPERGFRSGTPEIGYRHARLDRFRLTLAFDSPGLSIDSGAFGKGEGLDAAEAVLRHAGVESARLNFGGQILVFGSSTAAGRRYARAAIAFPDASGRLVSRVLLPDGSLSTSGDAEKPGHLIDPRTGRTAAFHGSATAFAPSGFRADALSTALFVMGPGEGIEFADVRQIPVLYVEASGARHASRAWRHLASWVDSTRPADPGRRSE